jgi:hypothetical protein
MNTRRGCQQRTELNEDDAMMEQWQHEVNGFSFYNLIGLDGFIAVLF